ncbi:hypothetical protein GCM10009715_38780 [Paeniglutamicibacter psychrophenolicus]
MLLRVGDADGDLDGVPQPRGGTGQAAEMPHEFLAGCPIRVREDGRTIELFHDFSVARPDTGCPCQVASVPPLTAGHLTA